MIPVHPLLIDLGLVERRDQLVRLGHDRLFPGWKPGRSKRGVVRWGAPVTKSFDEVRKRVGIIAENVSAYSLRHLFADWLDANALSARTRNRVMGHRDEANEADTYGSKSVLSKDDVARLSGFENRTVKAIADLLMGSLRAAGRGHLQLVPLAATMPRPSKAAR
jgi:integrase